MDQLFQHLRDKNEKEIKDEFDYLFVFIHTFIIHEFDIEVRN